LQYFLDILFPDFFTDLEEHEVKQLLFADLFCLTLRAPQVFFLLHDVTFLFLLPPVGLQEFALMLNSKIVVAKIAIKIARFIFIIPYLNYINYLFSYKIDNLIYNKYAKNKFNFSIVFKKNI
jgi:hypothetical protein